MVEWGHKLRERAAFTLIEVLVALGLIAVSLMLILGLIPAGIQSSQRASDVQAATGLARKLLEDCKPPEEFPFTATTEQGVETVGPTEFTWTRTVRTTGAYLYRTEVEIGWRAATRPVKLSLTRYNPAGPET